MLVPGTVEKVEVKSKWAPLKFLPRKLECGANVDKATGVLLKENMSFDKTFKEMIWYKYVGTKK